MVLQTMKILMSGNENSKATRRNLSIPIPTLCSANTHFFQYHISECYDTNAARIVLPTVQPSGNVCPFDLVMLNLCKPAPHKDRRVFQYQILSHVYHV